MKKKTDAQKEYDVSMRKEAEAHFNEQLSKKTIELEAKAEASKAMGFFEKMALDRGFNEILIYAQLYKLQNNKTHLKLGMDWEDFCKTIAIGVSRKTVDRILKDLKPIYDNFIGQMSNFVGVPFNKIRYLGRSLSGKMDNLSIFEDGDIIIDGVRIPFSVENKDEIEAGIDALKAANEEEKEKVKKLEKNIERTVKEETRGLTAERDLLIRENKRLKVFAPDDKDPQTWSMEQAREVMQACMKFVTCCQSFVMDKRIVDDFVAQAKAEEFIILAERALRGLRQKWQDEIDPVDDGM